MISRLQRSIQKPIVECLVAKGNATKLFAPVYIPCANTHADLLRLCVLLETLTHSQQNSRGGYGTAESVKLLTGEVMKLLEG